MSARQLLGSFLVALFFNNFLPSNIGGDVIRISDTARVARLEDAGGHRRAGRSRHGRDGARARGGVRGHARGGQERRRVTPPAVVAFVVLDNLPSWFWAVFVVGAVATTPALLAPAGVGRLLQPLTVFHPEWVGSAHRDADDRAGAVPGTPPCAGELLRRRRVRAGRHRRLLSGGRARPARAHRRLRPRRDRAVSGSSCRCCRSRLTGWASGKARSRSTSPASGCLSNRRCSSRSSATALVMLFSLTGVAVYVGRGSRT